MQKIRSLKPEEIEIRIQQITAKGVQLLLYKDSRCDKRILDETFGINGWKNRYEEIKGNLFCTISIWDDEKKQWVDKCDCGVESNGNDGNEKKGEASDSFKRAGFNVGIGRELYTRLFYFANVPTKKNDKGKYELENKYEKFTVAEISTNEETEKIEKIKIADSKGKIVFSYGYSQSKEGKNVTSRESKIDKNIEMVNAEQIKKIHMLFSKIEKTEKQVFKNFPNDKAKENVYNQFKVKSSKELTKIKADQMIELLSKKVGAISEKSND